MSEHRMVPFPERSKFAEVRMIYCERCGATQHAEATGSPLPPLPPCPSEPASTGLDEERLALAVFEAIYQSRTTHPEHAREDAEAIAAEYARLSSKGDSNG